MLKIYKNKTTTFKCEVHVQGEGEGTNINNVKSRLILYPTNDNRNMMFEGVVQGDICTIDINSNININKNGKAVLEIIVDDSTIFRPWNSLYEIYTSTVTVEGAQIIYDANKSKVVVNEITEPKKQKIKTKKVLDKLLEEAAGMIKDAKEVNEDSKSLLAAYKDSIKSLSKEELKAMVDFVKKGYTPKKHSLQWAKRVIGENTSTKSKLLMYCNELKTKGELL